MKKGDNSVIFITDKTRKNNSNLKTKDLNLPAILHLKHFHLHFRKSLQYKKTIFPWVYYEKINLRFNCDNFAF
jgi:hypothetical protein